MIIFGILIVYELIKQEKLAQTPFTRPNNSYFIRYVYVWVCIFYLEKHVYQINHLGISINSIG